MQPPDQEGSGADRPMKPISLEEVMAGNLDPYINWGDSSSGGLTGTNDTVDTGELDADNDLIDPPDMGDGAPTSGPDDDPF